MTIESDTIYIYIVSAMNTDIANIYVFLFVLCMCLVYFILFDIFN